MSQKYMANLHPPAELLPFLDVLAEILASSYLDRSLFKEQMASLIDGEPYLIMSLHKRSGTGARYSLNFSARNIQTPDEILLDINDNLLFHLPIDNDEQSLRITIETAFDEEDDCLANYLISISWLNMELENVLLTSAFNARLNKDE